jgi:hypothetical protein
MEKVTPAKSKEVSWWSLAAVAFLIGLFLGYYLGYKQVGQTLVPEESNAPVEAPLD